MDLKLSEHEKIIVDTLWKYGSTLSHLFVRTRQLPSSHQVAASHPIEKYNNCLTINDIDYKTDNFTFERIQ